MTSSRTFGWKRWPGMPSVFDRSPGPTKNTSMPSTPRMSGRFASAWVDSTIATTSFEP